MRLGGGTRVSRRLERFVLGLAMSAAAFLVDRRLRRARRDAGDTESGPGPETGPG